MSDTDLKNVAVSHTHGLRLEGTCGHHLVQPSCSKRDQLEQVTQDCVQLCIYTSFLMEKEGEGRCGAGAELDTVLPDVVSPVLNRGA